jgi:hypothetical protein
MIETIALVLTGIGLTASVVYYANILNNANKTQQIALETRQTQLFMQLFQYLNTETFWKLYIDTTYHTEWKDYEEFKEKYGPNNNPEMFAKISNIWMIYGELGTLVNDGVIEIDQIFELQGLMPVKLWEKWKPIVYAERKRVEWDDSYLHFEYLGIMMKRYFDEGQGEERLQDMKNQINPYR